VAELKPWQALPAGGVVDPATADKQRTGSWRTGVRPMADLSLCINCLLCWLNCPDAAVKLDGTTFVGFDDEFCKGCELCAHACPTGAIQMVPEHTEMPENGVFRSNGKAAGDGN
jgi:2-oxoacid:acceptor oxidoreductase delta subunit (pyruvate/2-ketoisovalerate family)